MIRPMHDTNRRRGLAPLEFVMALPMLLLMMAFIFKLADAGLIKAAMNVKARRQAWQQRGPAGGAENNPIPSAPSSLTGLRNAGDAPHGLSSASASKTVRLAPIAPASLAMEGRHVVLGDPSDYRTIGFQQRSRFSFDPRLFKVAKQQVMDLNKLTDPTSLFSKGMGAKEILDGVAKFNDAAKQLSEAIKKITELKAKAKEKKKKGGLLGALEGIADALGLSSLGDLAKAADAIPKAKSLLKDVGKLLDMMSAGGAPYE